MPEGSGSSDCHLCHIHDHAPSSTLLRTHPLRTSQRSRNPSKTSASTLHRNHQHHHHHTLNHDGGHHSRDNGTYRDSEAKQQRVASALAKLSERSHSVPGSRNNSLTRPAEVSILPNGSPHDHMPRSDTRSQREYNNVLAALLDTRVGSVASNHSHREPDILNALPRTHNNSRSSTLSRIQLHPGHGSNLTLAQDTDQDYYTHINRSRYKEESRKQRFNIQTVMLIGCYTMLFVVAIIVGVVLCQQNGWLGFGHGSSNELSDDLKDSRGTRNHNPSSMRDLDRPPRGRGNRGNRPGPTIDYDYPTDGQPPRINTAGVFPGGSNRGINNQKVPNSERDPLRTVNFRPANPGDVLDDSRKRPPGQRTPSPVGGVNSRNRFGEIDDGGVRRPGESQRPNDPNLIGSGKSIIDSLGNEPNNGLNNANGVNNRNSNLNSGQSRNNNPFSDFNIPGNFGGSRQPDSQNIPNNNQRGSNQNLNGGGSNQRNNPNFNPILTSDAGISNNGNGNRGNINGNGNSDNVRNRPGGDFGFSRGTQGDQPSGNFGNNQRNNVNRGSGFREGNPSSTSNTGINLNSQMNADGIRNLNSGSNSNRRGHINGASNSGGVGILNTGSNLNGNSQINTSPTRTMNFDNGAVPSGVGILDIGSNLNGNSQINTGPTRTMNFNNGAVPDGVRNSNAGSGGVGILDNSDSSFMFGNSNTGSSRGVTTNGGGTRGMANMNDNSGVNNFDNIGGFSEMGDLNSGLRGSTGMRNINSGSSIRGTNNFENSGAATRMTNLGRDSTNSGDGMNNFNTGSGTRGSTFQNSGIQNNFGTGTSNINLPSNSAGINNRNSNPNLGATLNDRGSTFDATQQNRGNANQMRLPGTQTQGGNLDTSTRNMGNSNSNADINSNLDIPLGSLNNFRLPTAIPTMRDLGNGDRRRMPGGRNLNLDDLPIMNTQNGGQNNNGQQNKVNGMIKSILGEVGTQVNPSSNGQSSIPSSSGQSNIPSSSGQSDIASSNIQSNIPSPNGQTDTSSSNTHNWDGHGSKGQNVGSSGSTGRKLGGFSTTNLASQNTNIHRGGVSLPGLTAAGESGTPKASIVTESGVNANLPENSQGTPLKVMKGFSVQRGEVVAISTIKSTAKDISILQPDHDVIFHITPSAPDAGVTLIRHPNQDPNEMEGSTSVNTGPRRPQAPVLRRWEHTDPEGTHSRGLVRKDGSFAFTNCRPSEVCHPTASGRR